MNILSARVVEYRKRKGLTQEELADALHVSRSILSLVEAGTRSPSKELAKRLAVYFQVSTDVFLFEDIKPGVLEQKTISTAQILMLADIVQEYLDKNGYNITPEQRAALVEHF